MRRTPHVNAVAALLGMTLASCGTGTTTLPGGWTSAPPGADVTTPFPIDRGDDGAGTPGRYKGLWLRLVDRPGPTITPVDGVVGVVCIGMSNGNQECDELIQQVAGAWHAEVNPAVRIVNCAVGGHAIERWIDPADDETLWNTCIDHKLGQAGVRLDQVQVIYHKAANQYGIGPGGAALPLYPAAGSDYDNFLANLGAFAARVHGKFPAVRAVYTSSRSYGGYSNNVARNEPLSYEEGHALNSWLAGHAAVDGVWYGWGAYLWASDCGTGPANGSGVCYNRADYQDDGVHPTASGRLKIARMMHDRLQQEAWYRP